MSSQHFYVGNWFSTYEETSVAGKYVGSCAVLERYYEKLR